RRLHDSVEGRPARGQPLRLGRAGRRLGRPTPRNGPALPLGGGATDRDTRDQPRVVRYPVDLVIRNGTVVTAARSFTADVAVSGGSIAVVDTDLSSLAATAHDVVDASGLLVLPGCIDVHTHTRVASDDEPDRFFQDSVAAAFGGTTSFLAFNNPGTGSSAKAHRSILAGIHEFLRATASDSAIDFGLSPAILGGMVDPLGELAAMVDAGVPTANAFMVFDFRLADRTIFEAMRTLGQRGGMLEVHCE